LPIIPDEATRQNRYIRLAEDMVNITEGLMDGETAALYHETGVKGANYE
jgi:hypothetical protein